MQLVGFDWLRDCYSIHSILTIESIQGRKGPWFNTSYVLSLPLNLLLKRFKTHDLIPFLSVFYRCSFRPTFSIETVSNEVYIGKDIWGLLFSTYKYCCNSSVEVWTFCSWPSKITMRTMLQNSLAHKRRILLSITRCSLMMLTLYPNGNSQYCMQRCLKFGFAQYIMSLKNSKGEPPLSYYI